MLPPMSLDRAALDIVHAAALRCRLEAPESRDLLFDGLSIARGLIPRPPEPAAALLADLIWLAAHPHLQGIDGPPLAVWLRNAAQATWREPECAIFRHHRAVLLGPEETRPEPFPERPWPLLHPYTDARLFAGRDREVQDLIAFLDRGHLITGLYAPSGFGKSSFLRAGLLAALRRPVALDDTPHQPQILARLLRRAGLPIDPLPPDEAPAALFAAFEHPPVLVLDQCEEIFKADAAARARVATLLRAVQHPAHIILSYREEYHGRMQRWLADEVGTDLSPCFAAFRLPPLAAEAFAEAIEHPARVHPGGWRVEGGAHLAAAFAAARRADPTAPLVPELQVVLSQLVDESPDQVLRVPEDAPALIEDALTRHLRRHLKRLAPTPEAETTLWLGLRRLCTPDGKRTPQPLSHAALARSLPVEVLSDLCRFEVRILFPARDPETGELVYALSHDSLARELVFHPPPGAPHLFELERLIAQRSALFGESKDSAHLALDCPTRRLITLHPGRLFNPERQAWWAAARRHATHSLLKRAGQIAFATLAATAIALGLRWIETNARVDEALGVITRADPQRDGELILPAIADVLALRPDEPRLVHLIEQRRPWSALLAAPERDVEAARRWLFERLLPRAEVPLESGHLAAAIELGRHPTTPGRWDEVEYQATRQRLHDRLVEQRGKPPAAPWQSVPSGTFTMGSTEQDDEKPPHEVTFTRALDVMRHEVTRGLYLKFDPEAAKTKDRIIDWQAKDLETLKNHLDELPMWGVDWYEAQAFAIWLDPQGRLPTEAEWEYLARGGTTTRFWTGDEVTSIEEVGWFRENSAVRTGGNEVHPVCEREPKGEEGHPFDLCDTAGNLVEWTADAFEPGVGYEVENGLRRDPAGPRRGVLRALRGGSFVLGAAFARSAYRYGNAPVARDPSIGFRVVRPAPLGP